MAWTTPRTWVAGELVTASLLNTHLRDNLVAVQDRTWPVGSIFEAKVSTNPATLLGFGTWSAYGTGRVLVAIDTGQTEFDVLEETGGAKTHTLSSAEMPSHTHVQDAHNHTQNSHNHTQDAHNHTQDAHGHQQNNVASQAGAGSGIDVLNNFGASYATGSPNAYIQPTPATNQAATATNQAATATNQATTATNQNTGGGGAHNNLQPYIVIYRWVRTA